MHLRFAHRLLRQTCLALLLVFTYSTNALALAHEIVFVLTESDRVESPTFVAQKNFVDQALDQLQAGSDAFEVGIGAYSDIHRAITPGLLSLSTDRAALDASVLGIVQSMSVGSFPGLAAKKAKLLFDNAGGPRTIVLFTSGHAHGTGFFATHSNNVAEIEATHAEGIEIYIVATPAEGGFLSPVGLPAYAEAGGGHDVFGIDEGSEFGAALAGTPEPSTVLLCMGGLLAMAAARRRR